MQACVFARNIDAVHFFIISLMLLFRRDQHNRTLVLYAFPAVSLAEMGRSEVEICFAAVMLSSARARASTMPYRPNAARAGRFRSMPATNSGMLIGLAKNVSAGPIGGKGCFGTT